MLVKRVSSVFLVALVLAACLAVPSSAGFAAGVTADGYNLVRADTANDLYEATPSSYSSHLVSVQEFFDASPVYEYMNGRDSDIIRLGVAIYTYDIQGLDTSDVFGCFLLGSVLNARFPTGNGPYSSFVDNCYYPVAISRSRNAQFGRVWSDYGTFRNANSKNSYGTNSFQCAYSYPSDDDPYFWFNVIQPNNRYERGFISDTEWFYSSSSLYDSWDQLMTALDFAESGSGDTPDLIDKYFSLLPGYAVAIQFQRGSVDLSYTAPSYAVRPGVTAYLGPQYFYADGGVVPESVLFSTSYAPSTSNHNNIPFSGVPPATIDNLTRSFKASFSYDVGHSQACLVLYNPLYVPTYANAGNFVTDGSNTSSDNRVSNSIAIHISAQSISRIRLYPLKSSLSSSLTDGQIVSSSSDDAQVIDDVSPDASGAPAWETGGEESYNPVIGGNTLPDELSDDGFFSWLTSLFEKFTSIFTWGHEAIITVFNSASGFIARLGSLYSWLPPEVTAVISGCIILVLVIGLIKVLL